MLGECRRVSIRSFLGPEAAVCLFPLSLVRLSAFSPFVHAVRGEPLQYDSGPGLCTAAPPWLFWPLLVCYFGRARCALVLAPCPCLTWLARPPAAAARCCCSCEKSSALVLPRRWPRLAVIRHSVRREAQLAPPKCPGPAHARDSHSQPNPSQPTVSYRVPSEPDSNPPSPPSLVRLTPTSKSATPTNTTPNLAAPPFQSPLVPHHLPPISPTPLHSKYHLTPHAPSLD